MTITADRRRFLAGMLGLSVIAVLPKAATLADAAPVLDPFAVEAPEGLTYQWVRCALLGEPDPQNVQLRLDNGWTFVPPDRHPDVPTYDIDVAIGGSGLVLMQKTTVLIEQSKPRALPTIPQGLWQDNRRTEGGVPISVDAVRDETA